jgi:hypothetical protein
MSDVATRLVESHRQFLGFLERRLGDRALAEDLLQDAFVKRWRRAEIFAMTKLPSRGSIVCCATASSITTAAAASAIARSNSSRRSGRMRSSRRTSCAARSARASPDSPLI